MSGTGNLEQEDANQEKSIVIYDLEEKRMIWRIQTQDFTGKLMAINDELAIGFYEHPKLFNLKTGEIIYRWLEMPTDNQNSSIYTSDSFSHIAIDPTNKRFAVALADRIEVVALA